jgi:polysaccharide export outer membrane protein
MKKNRRIIQTDVLVTRSRAFHKLSLLLACCMLFSLALQPAGLAEETEAGTTADQSKGDTYIIGSGDVLQIMTWKEPDFTLEEVRVRTDGKISFPVLNDVQAAGMTPLQLKEAIETGLKDYVEGPFVTVTVKDPQSKKFYILGEVTNTGEFPLTKNLTVLQAFAIAGGFTEWASKKEIMLLRKEDGKEKIYRINYTNIIKGRDIEQNMELKANDTIIVP